MLVTGLRRTAGVPNTKCEKISPSDKHRAYFTSKRRVREIAKTNC